MSIENSAQKAISVLILERDQKQAEIITAILTTNKYISVLLVGNSEEALFLMKHSDNYSPDVVVMEDILDTDESSSVLADMVLSRNTKATIFVLTSDAEDRAKQSSMNFNNYCFIPKPLNLAKFKKIVENYVHIAQALHLDSDCGIKCNNRCRLLNHVIPISTEKDIIDFGQCLNKINDTNKMYENPHNMTKVNYLYDFLFSVVECGQNINIIYYQSDKLTSCMFVLNSVTEGLAKSSYFYPYVKDSVFFGQQACSINISGTFNPEEGKLSFSIPSNYTGSEQRMSAVEFMGNLNHEELQDVETIFESLDELFVSVSKLDSMQDIDRVANVIKSIEKVRNTLAFFNHFDTLCASINYMSETLSNIVNTSNAIKYDAVVEFLYMIAEEFSEWADGVFKKQSVNNIRYMNESIMASVMQFEQTYYGAPMIPVSETNIEFF